MRQPGFSSRLDRFCKAALIALLSFPSAAAATDLCDSATDRLFLFSEPAPGISGDGQRCYTTELPAAGVWLVDVSTAAGADVLPSLWISTIPCNSTTEETDPFLRELRRTSSSALLRVLAPGKYLFCVTAREPGQTLGRHWVTSLFGPNATAGDPDEDEPDPRPVSNLDLP